MKKLVLALAAASMVVPTTMAEARPHHNHGHHYGERYKHYTPKYRVYNYNYRYQPYYYGQYWRYNNYYHCRKTDGGIGILVDYDGNLVFTIRDSRIICR